MRNQDEERFGQSYDSGENRGLSRRSERHQAAGTEEEPEEKTAYRSDRTGAGRGGDSVTETVGYYRKSAGVEGQDNYTGANRYDRISAGEKSRGGFTEAAGYYRESAGEVEDGTADRNGYSGWNGRYRANTGMGAENGAADRNRYAEQSGRYRADAGTRAEDETTDWSRYAEQSGRYQADASTRAEDETTDWSRYVEQSGRYRTDAGMRADAEIADRSRYAKRNRQYRADAGTRAEGGITDRSRYAERSGRYRRSAGTKSRESGAERKKYSFIDSIRNRRTASRQGKQAEWTPGSRLREEWKQFTAYVNESWRVRLLLVLCAFLLIGMVTKYATDRIFYREMDITDAFVVTDSGCLESRMQITVDYGTAFLTEHDKQALIGYLANSLGIRMEGAADYQENEVSQVYTYHKEAKRAATTIKAITLRQDTSRTYLYTELVIRNDINFDILSYRDILLEALKDLQVVQSETTMQFLGAYDGELPLERWDRIANSMIKELGGKIIYENRDKELYTIYAYSSQLPEYVSVDQKKINIQVAMRYEEDNDRTVVYLATPLLRGDW